MNDPQPVQAGAELLVEQVARLVKPTAFQLRDELERTRGLVHDVTGEEMPPEERAAAGALADKECAEAEAKARSIIAVLNTRITHAGGSSELTEAPETYIEWQQKRGRMADKIDEVRCILADHYEIRMQPKFVHEDVHKGAANRIFAALTPDDPSFSDHIAALTDELTRLREKVEVLTEALAQTQWMLDTIVRSHSTNFNEVHERIIANRQALADQPK